MGCDVMSMKVCAEGRRTAGSDWMSLITLHYALWRRPAPTPWGGLWRRALVLLASAAPRRLGHLPVCSLLHPHSSNVAVSTHTIGSALFPLPPPSNLAGFLTLAGGGGAP